MKKVEDDEKLGERRKGNQQAERVADDRKEKNRNESWRDQ